MTTAQHWGKLIGFGMVRDAPGWCNVGTGQERKKVDANPKQLDPGQWTRLPVSAHVPAKMGKSGVSSTLVPILRPVESDTR